MVEVVTYPNATVEAQVQAYIHSATSRAGITMEHDLRWLAVLHESLGHRPYMVVARNGRGDVCGYLPLALVTGRLFGRFLVSLPYLNRAGVAAADHDTAQALIDEAVRLAADRNVQYLELRHGDPIAHESLPRSRQDKMLMVLDLPGDADGLWGTIGSKVRNQVRKGDKHDLSIRWGGAELVDDFYGVFSVNMRDLGTPVYTRKLFDRILEHFAGEAELAVVDHAGQPISAALLVYDDRGRSTQVPSAACLRQYNWTNANMWMYHRLLGRAIERGAATFDFGRSSEDSGAYRFKKQWGATPRPTVWQYHLRRGDINTVRPGGGKYQRRIAAWQKLPVWVTRLIGPPIVKGIP